MKIKKFLQFLNEDYSEIIDDKYFRLSDKLYKLMISLKDTYKIAELFFKLKSGVSSEYLVNDPVDYLDIDDDGNISFLKSRYFTELDRWSSSRRVKMKATKVLREIYNESYINEKTKQTDFEAFANKLATLKDNMGIRIEEFRGEDCLRGYNYKHEFNKKFGHSCANFHQAELGGGYREPWVDEYDVYVKNPENCGIVVVWDSGEIVYRKSFQQGIQVCNAGEWKKGEYRTVYGNGYGIGGRGGKYDTIINDYLRKKYNAIQCGTGWKSNTAICINIETRWKNYPAFDSMYVCFEHNLLSDNYGKLSPPYKTYNWVSTYPGMGHQHCPQHLIDQRLKEEAEKNVIVQPEVQPDAAPWGPEELEKKPTYYRDKNGRFRRKTS